MTTAAMTATDTIADSGTRAAGDSVKRYLDEIGRYPLLSRTDEIRLARLAEAGDTGAKRRLVESNLRLVVAIARRYRGHGVDLMDLVQEGNIGLMSAAERFDWRRSVKFSTYAAWWIRRAICRAITTSSRTVRLPDRLAELAPRIRYAEDSLAQRLCREPSIEEIAGESGVSAETVAELRRAEGTLASLHEPLGDGDATLADVIADGDCGDHAQGLIEDAELQGVKTAVSSLNERSRRVIELRFGLDGNRSHALTDIAGELGLSRERVRQLESKALRQLAARPELRQLQVAA